MKQRVKLALSEILHKLNYVPSADGESLKQKIIRGLKKDGFYTLEGFLSAEDCAELRNRTDMFIENNQDKVSLESNGSDKRVYGVNKHDNSFVIDKIEKLSDEIFGTFSFIINKDYFYLLGKIVASDENLGSGSGWHRDSPISNQFKTILYLSDVNKNNGPFQYIRASHTKKAILKANGFLQKPLNSSRFDDNEINSLVENQIVEEPTTFEAPQGTLVFVNTRGLHRGAPLKDDCRYALTRYHFAKKNKKFR